MKLYIGNLSFDSTEDDIRELFSQYGEIVDVSLITDRETGRPRGFGFIEFKEESSGREAISGLDGTEFASRQLKVNEAKPRTERTGGGGGGGRRNW
ncbi:MAG: RNA-binding protein [Planctomycetes bacterium]|nr:RNA-binding protein [Planctomycetota bacterium]